MTAGEAGSSAAADGPSMLDLIRLSPRPIFPPGGRDLYRQIAILSDMEAGREVLVVGCGRGVTAEFFVREFEVQGSGVDDRPDLVEEAEDRARREDLQDRLQFQSAPLDELPYRDGVFDVVVAELGLTARAEPADAMGELVRVTKPGGRVVLVQPVWKAPVPEERRRILGRHLGAHPLMMVEVKRILREAGVHRFHTEAWSDADTAFRSGARKPFPDFAELFTLREKLAILRRAWRRWGWKGVRQALSREMEVHRLLTRERILGLDMITGVRRLPPEDPEPGGADGAPGPDDSKVPASDDSDATEAPEVGEALADPGPGHDEQIPFPLNDSTP
ncbi:MAG: methyltransferase domain-containing protein [Gemmatimonadales bacterium]|nr:MAG: methyltransferase domain-containing protein [Gemmatimonadales bacterium]